MDVTLCQAAMRAGAQPDGARLPVGEVRRRFCGDVLAGSVGEILCLVGSFGQEKPALLWLIAGVDRPDGRRILPGDDPLGGPSGLVEPEGRPGPVEGVVTGITLMGEIAQLRFRGSVRRDPAAALTCAISPAPSGYRPPPRRQAITGPSARAAGP